MTNNKKPAQKRGLGSTVSSFSSSISSASQQTGIPASLISSVISAESSGNPLALSPTGAQGLMQLEPATGQEVASQLGISNFDPNNPDQNILVGSTYLASLVKQFGGDVSTALAAYNWGPGNVSSGKSWPSSVQSYVSKILGSAGIDSSDSSALSASSGDDDSESDIATQALTPTIILTGVGILLVALLFRKST